MNATRTKFSLQRTFHAKACPTLWEGRQRGSGAQQVGTYLDGLAEFGFGLRLVFEAQVPKAGEVMGVGGADAG
jgi:hypothetical protein